MKTTDTIKEQRKRREARVKLISPKTPLGLYMGEPFYSTAEFACKVNATNYEQEINDAENALQAMRASIFDKTQDAVVEYAKNLNESLKKRSIKYAGIENQTPLYKPKAGLDFITPDWAFIRQGQHVNSVFLLDGKRVIVVESCLSTNGFGICYGNQAVLKYVDVFSGQEIINDLSKRLIYCAEYEMVEL